jgi:RES domain-containing protein
MLLYRISKTKYAGDLSGEGARRGGGRWNFKGTPVVYTADSTALATLETLVHSPLNLLPKNMSIVTINLPNELSVTTIKVENLPNNWATYPAPTELAKIGTDWTEKQEAVALCVPSSVTPTGEGRNYILNPLHSDFRQVEIIQVKAYLFDSRLFQR